MFLFIGHALWAALLAPNNLPGAAHGSQDLIYVLELKDNLNVVEMYGDASNTGGCANRRHSLSGSASPHQSLFEALFCSGRQLSRAAGELFPSGLLLESVVRPFSVYLFVVVCRSNIAPNLH